MVRVKLLRKRLRVGAKNKLASVFEKKRNTDGSNKDSELRLSTQRAIGKPLDCHSDDGANAHSPEEHDGDTNRRHRILKMWHDSRRQIIARESTEHEDVAMREIDEAQYA